MKITDIRTIVVGNPWKNWVFVIVETSEGIAGLGEAINRTVRTYSSGISAPGRNFNFGLNIKF